MSRGPKPVKSKVGAKPPVARKDPKDDDTRVRDLEKRLAEALNDKGEALQREAVAREQQAATAEILQVISQSLTDVQPVFDMIAANAVRLCDGYFSAVYISDGKRVHVRATHNLPPEWLRLASGVYPAPLDSELGSVQVVRERRVIHVHDAQEIGRAASRRAQISGYRTWIGIPMMAGSHAVGTLAVARQERKPFSEQDIALLQTFADQAVIAIENTRLFNETKEALERQTATSEVLRVISSSPTDLQPVFDAIAESAVRLCDAMFGGIFRVDGENLRAVGRHGPIAVQGLGMPIKRGTVAGRTVLERRTVHVTDLQAEAEEFPESSVTAKELGHRTTLGVPLLLDETALGAIVVRRAEAKPFTDRQIALLKTFADQAVIAIENVRLFTELQEKNQALTQAHAQVTESLDQQTATAEILRVISHSPMDVQPVFDAIASSAVRLCESTYGIVHRFDGTNIEQPIAMYNVTAEQMALYRQIFPLAASMETALGESVLTRRTVHVEDTLTEHRYTSDTRAKRVAREVLGYRSLLVVPMVHGDQALGTIVVWRREQRPFSRKQIALVETFADQAVIAIENVRLFKELQASNRDLITALDKQTATSDVLRVISQSQTDVQPVFEAILSSAIRLMSAQAGALTRVTGDQLELAAFKGTDDRSEATLREAFPQSLQSEGTHTKAIRDRAPVNIADAQTDPRLRAIARSIAQAVGYHSMVAVPMLYQDGAIGTISTTRREAGGFTADEISLLQTFADQAVIAIENVRLFTELQEKNRALTQAHAQVSEALEQQTATSEILGVISGFPRDIQPVFDAIIANAVRLCGGVYGIIWRYDGEFVNLVGLHNLPVESREELIGQFPRRLDDLYGPLPTALRTGTVVDIPDVGRYDDPGERMRKLWQARGVRSVVMVPIRQESGVAGAISVSHPEVGAFSADRVELLKTFASQAVIAIENVRLFNELEAANRHLEAASRHKSEFLANMSHELRTPLNAIIGFSEVLSERMFGELNEKQEEYSKDIHASGQHLLSLINDILDLSKIEAGRMELELTDFHLPTALDSALTLVRERAGRRGIALQMNVDSRLGQILADERKVRQVILNLLSNAIKFTPEGGRIEVAATPQDGLVEISVGDTGVGIAPADQEAVFEEFRQVGTADKRVEGTGLGLTLCRKFVELHGGRIWLKSEVGAGSTFTFSLPLPGKLWRP